MRYRNSLFLVLIFCLLACALGCTTSKKNIGNQKREVSSAPTKETSTVHDDWIKTSKSTLIASYEGFLNKYPNSIYESEARWRIEEISAENEWKDARQLDTISAYQ